MPKPKAESTLAIVERFSAEMYHIAQVFNSPNAPPELFSTANIMDAAENLFVGFSLKDGPADARLYLCCGSDSEKLAQFCRAHEDTLDLNVFDVTIAPKKALPVVVELTDFEIKNYSSTLSSPSVSHQTPGGRQSNASTALSSSVALLNFLVARVQLADNAVPSCSLCEATIHHILQLGGGGIGKYILALFLNFNKVRSPSSYNPGASMHGKITASNLHSITQDCSYHYLHRSFSMPVESTVMYVSYRSSSGKKDGSIDAGMCVVPSAGGNILFAEKKRCSLQNLVQLVSQQIEASNVTHCCCCNCGVGGAASSSASAYRLSSDLVDQLSNLHYMTTFTIGGDTLPSVFWFDKHWIRNSEEGATTSCSSSDTMKKKKKAAVAAALEAEAEVISSSAVEQERALISMLGAVIAPHASRSVEECASTCRALGYNINSHPLSIRSFLNLFRDAPCIRLPGDTTFADAISRSPVTPYDPSQTLNMFSGNNRKITGTKKILGKLVACETNLGRSYYREMINAPFTDSKRLARHYELVCYASQQLPEQYKSRIRAWDLERLQTAILKGEFSLIDFIEIQELLENMYVGGSSGVGGGSSRLRNLQEEEFASSAAAAACRAFAPISAAADGAFCLPEYKDILDLHHYITEELPCPVTLKHAASRELLVFLTGGAAGISETDLRRLHTMLATDITRGGAYLRVENLADLRRLRALLEPLVKEDDHITETLLGSTCLTTHTKPEPKDFVAGAVDEYTKAVRKTIASFTKNPGALLHSNSHLRQIEAILLHCIPSPHRCKAREGSAETVEAYCFKISELREALFYLLEMMLMLSTRRVKSAATAATLAAATKDSAAGILLCSYSHDMELPGLMYLPPYMPKCAMAAGPLVCGKKMEKNIVYPINEVRERVLTCNGLRAECQERTRRHVDTNDTALLEIEEEAISRSDWKDKPSTLPIKTMQIEWASVHTPQVKKKFSFVDPSASTGESDKFAIVYDRMLVDLLQPLLALYRGVVLSNISNAVGSHLVSAKQGHYMRILLNVIRSTANIDKMISISKLFLCPSVAGVISNSNNNELTTLRLERSNSPNYSSLYKNQRNYSRRSRINVIVPVILSNEARPSGFSARGISNDLTYEGRRVYMASSKYNIDLWDSGKDSVILYGQNGVGKTTLLDAIFLNVLMAQAGIGAMAEHFELVPYKNLVVHYTNTIDRHVIHAQSPFMNDVDVINFTRTCEAGKTLAICDEILTTTNPDQGVDLLAATLNSYTNCGVQYVCATHYRELDKASLSARIMNISRNEEDGRRVLSPGAGDVFDVFTIVEKAGMPASMANEARERNRKRKRDTSSSSNVRDNSSILKKEPGEENRILLNTPHSLHHTSQGSSSSTNSVVDVRCCNERGEVSGSGMSRLDAFRFRRTQNRRATAAYAAVASATDASVANAAAASAASSDPKNNSYSSVDFSKWTKSLPSNVAGKPCIYNSHKVYTGLCENYKQTKATAAPGAECINARLFDAGYWCVATQIDHIVPQYIFRADPTMNNYIQMNSEANLQELCPECHAKKTAEESAMRAHCRDTKDVVEMYKQMSLKKINDLFA